VPAVFVHGVPDTAAMWEPLVARLQRTDVVTLALPGFGNARPEGFAATKEAYADWLVGQIEAFGEPVDIVGHDWGCLLTVRAVCLVPERIRSWAAGSGPVDAGYVWHDTAQLWQTPAVGEQVMEAMTPELLAGVYTSEGFDDEHAATAAARVDDEMKQCILDLYRSAVTVGAEWGPDLAAAAPNGLLLWGERDPYAGVDFAHRMAAATGAAVQTFDCGHWWPVAAADGAAAALEAHWAAAG
jgi:pimeloyl-ACP methyl ester carboxylesterase